MHTHSRQAAAQYNHRLLLKGIMPAVVKGRGGGGKCVLFTFPIQIFLSLVCISQSDVLDNLTITLLPSVHRNSDTKGRLFRFLNGPLSQNRFLKVILHCVQFHNEKGAKDPRRFPNHVKEEQNHSNIKAKMNVTHVVLHIKCIFHTSILLTWVYSELWQNHRKKGGKCSTTLCCKRKPLLKTRLFIWR